MKTVKIKCPECKRLMEVRSDSITKDWYAQCRNQKCNFDGTYANSPEELVIALYPAMDRVKFAYDGKVVAL